MANSLRWHHQLLLLLIAFLLLPSPKSYSQGQSDSHAIGDDLKADGTTILLDAGSIITSPLRFSGTDWLYTGGAFAGIAALHGIDGDARTFALRNHSGGTDDIASAAKAYGNGVYAIGGSVVVYSIGLFGHESSTRETGLMMIEAIGFAGVATDVAKIIVGRSRPYTEDGPHSYKLFQTDNDYNSMPSGHTTVAFALSSVLAARIQNRYATFGLFSVAALTAYSRMYDDQHWLSDVVAGGAIGTAMGLAVAGLHETQTPPDQQSGFRFTPTLNGLAFVYRF